MPLCKNHFWLPSQRTIGLPEFLRKTPFCWNSRNHCHMYAVHAFPMPTFVSSKDCLLAVIALIWHSLLVTLCEPHTFFCTVTSTFLLSPRNLILNFDFGLYINYLCNTESYSLSTNYVSVLDFEYGCSLCMHCLQFQINRLGTREKSKHPVNDQKCNLAGKWSGNSPVRFGGAFDSVRIVRSSSPYCAR